MGSSILRETFLEYSEIIFRMTHATSVSFCDCAPTNLDDVTFSVIKMWKHPPLRLLRIQYLRRDVAVVVVIACNHVPVLLQRWVAVDPLVGRIKPEIVHVFHPVVIKVVSNTDEEVNMWNL